MQDSVEILLCSHKVSASEVSLKSVVKCDRVKPRIYFICEVKNGMMLKKKQYKIDEKSILNYYELKAVI